MRTLFVLTALSVVTCSACSSGTYVNVTVESGTPLSVTTLDVTITNSGMKGHATFNKGGQPFILPQSLGLQLDDSRSGEAVIEVVATGASGELARATKTTQLVTHGTAAVTVTLLQPLSGDMGVGDMTVVPDLMPAPPDMSKPKQLSFAPAKNSPAGMGTTAAALGDFDRDHKLDVVVTNVTDKTLSVLLGKGDGTFATSFGTFTGTSAFGIAVADVDSDTAADVFLAEGPYQPSDMGMDLEIREYLGAGNGKLQQPNILPVGSGTGRFAIADCNGDTKLDVVMTSSGNNAVLFFSGDGKGGLGSPTTTMLDRSPGSVALMDMDGDGKLDIVLTTTGPASVAVLRGNGNGTFLGPTYTAVGGSPVGLVGADFNGDKKQDLATGEFVGKAVSILLNKGGGAFDFSTIALGVVYSIATGDFNADGRVDIAVTQQGDQVTVLLGHGDGNFDGPVRYSVDTAPRTILVGDFNRDGLDDILTANYGGNDVSVLLNTSQ